MKVTFKEDLAADIAKDFASATKKEPIPKSASFEKVHPKVGLTLNNLGNTYFRNGEYKAALESYQDALATFAEIYQEEHVDIANTLGNIGNTYWRIGNMTQAANFLEYSLHVHRLVLNAKNDDSSDDDDDTVEIANTLHSLGIVYYLQGKSDKALKIFNKALKSRENVFGVHSVDVARTLDAIGSVNLQKGYNLNAIQTFEESLRIKRALLGTNHASIVVTMKHLANAYRSKLDYCKALNLYEEVLNAQTIDDFSCFTLNDIGETLQLIGEIYMQRMQHNYAIPYFENALSKFEKAGVREDDGGMVQLRMCLNAAMNVASLRSSK